MNKQEHNNTTDLSVTNAPETTPDTMDTKKSIRKKAVIGAAAILGACTLIFGGVTQMVLAAETSKNENVPTTYSSSSQKPADTLAGYVKGNYTVKRYEGNETVTPNANAISMEQAAEIAAQYSWRLFGDNLDGKTLEVSYDTDENTWWVDVGQEKDSEGVETWSYFEVNALNGAVYTATRDRTFPYTTGKQMTDEISDDPAVFAKYKELARADTEQHHLLSGNISSFRKSGWGSNESDSHIVIEVSSDIGEKIQLGYSYVDDALVSYVSDDWHQASEMWSSQQTPYDPQLGALEAANMAKLDQKVVHELKEDEKGILYADYVNENGEVIWLRVGHTDKYTGE